MNVDPNLLIVLVGLPRSGKTTWALDHILPVVSPDAIRQVLLASNTPVVGQPMVDHLASFQIRSLFMVGHRRVILDDCNVKREDRDRWYPKAKEPTWEVAFHALYTDKEVCIERAVPEHYPVIEAMAEEFEILEADEGVYDGFYGISDRTTGASNRGSVGSSALPHDTPEKRDVGAEERERAKG